MEDDRLERWRKLVARWMQDPRIKEQIRKNRLTLDKHMSKGKKSLPKSSKDPIDE